MHLLVFLFLTLSHIFSYEQYEELLGKILLESLYDSINSHYDSPRTIWNIEILEVEKLNESIYDYKFTLEFETFQGAHNPPYDKNTGVYVVKDFMPLEIEELHFEHYEINILKHKNAQSRS